MIRCLAFVLILLLPGALAAQSAAEVDLAKAALRALQAQSIKGNREYCGLIGRDRFGGLIASEAARGNRARCRYPDPPPDTVVVATFHTHGAFLRNYDNEVPSVLDVMSEMLNGTHGYVSTPGGRFWFVDGRRGTIRLICGPKCLPWDPRYVEGVTGPIASKYTLDDLKQRQFQR